MMARTAFSSGVLLLAAVPVSAQNGEIALLAQLIQDTGSVQDVDASSFQLHRIPIGITLRAPESARPGVRLTFPVTLGSYRLSADTDLGDVVESLRAMSITPGLEMQVPVGERWLLRPFAEVELASVSADETDALFSAGIRTRGRYRLGTTRLTAGGEVRWSSPRTRRDLLSDYTSLGIGLDAQVPLGLRLGSHEALAGVYGIARVFPNLEIGGSNRESYAVGETWELGVSFSTEPTLELWRIPVPWIAVGYRFGDLFEGFRVSLAFPF